MRELSVFVGRQPIFDRSGNIFGYELLYRNSEQNKFPRKIDSDKATIELLVNTFLTIGIDRLVGQTKSFINFSQKTLEQDVAELLDPRFVIIELLEDIELTEDVIHSLTKLRKMGFKIALDDFSIKKDFELLPKLFETVNIIKIDFLNTTAQERRQIEALVKKYRHLTMLAEKIESKDNYEEAQKYGYLLFQGYYFSRPQIIKGKEIPPNYLLHFQILKELNEEMPNIDKISDLFSHDISLSYKLLRYINSLTFDIPNKISSINQAIMLMGLREVRRWLRILLLREIGVGTGRGREKSLIERSLVRAKLIELLARYNGKRNADEYFLAGLFSLIDVIMSNNMKNILPQLSLSNNISETLLGGKTEITPYLNLAISLESLEMDKIQQESFSLSINEDILIKFVQESHRWATVFD